MRKTCGELARQLLEMHGGEALHEAECLVALHKGFGGERFYAEVLAEVRRRFVQSRLRPLPTAGYLVRDLDLHKWSPSAAERASVIVAIGSYAGVAEPADARGSNPRTAQV